MHRTFQRAPHALVKPLAFEHRESDEEFLDRYYTQLRRALDQLRDIPRGVAILGSARINENDVFGYYKQTEELAYELGVRFGLPIYTGGGPGLMEAANKGARRAGVPSVGLCLVLEALAEGAPFLDIRCDFDDFDTRLAIFKRKLLMGLMLPGGIGTLHEGADFGDNKAKGKFDFPSMYYVELDDDHSFWTPTLAGITAGPMVDRGMVGKKELDTLEIIHRRQVIPRLLEDLRAKNAAQAVPALAAAAR